MGDLFTINVVYSTQHWIFPTIIIGVLLLLGLVIIVAEGVGRVRAGKGFFTKPGRFFEEHFDKIKFWGTIALLVLYFALLPVIGFTVCSIIFVFLFNTLFGGMEHLNAKYLVNSAIISIVAVLIISILFGTVFNISLPEGFCTIWIKSLGITIF